MGPESHARERLWRHVQRCSAYVFRGTCFCGSSSLPAGLIVRRAWGRAGWSAAWAPVASPSPPATVQRALWLCGRQPSRHSSPFWTGRPGTAPRSPCGAGRGPAGALALPAPDSSFLRARSIQRPGFTGDKTLGPKQPFRRSELGPEPLTRTLLPAHTSHAFLVENGDPGVCSESAPLGRRELQEGQRVVPSHTVGWSGSTLCPQAGGAG